MDCHSPERARNLAAGPLVLPEELQQPDRRELDDAVFEMLGVSDSAARSELIDRLYEATSQHFRDIRVVEIEKMDQRGRSEGKRLNVHDLAADIWDAVELNDSVSVRQWLTESPGADVWVDVPEDRPVVLLDNPLFPDHTVYFGRSRKELVHRGSRSVARTGPRSRRTRSFVAGPQDMRRMTADSANDLSVRLEPRLGTTRHDVF